MTIAKVINIGAEQLIALPAGFHIDAEQVNISKQKNSFLIKIVRHIDNKPNQDMSDRQSSFLAWRKAYDAALTEADYQDWDDPWENVRSKEVGREFNWED